MTSELSRNKSMEKEDECKIRGGGWECSSDTKPCCEVFHAG